MGNYDKTAALRAVRDERGACLASVEDLHALLLALMGGEAVPAPPEPERVIVNGPAVVALWDDGTKTKAVARDGDEFDASVGAAICAFRKVTRNRASVAEWEGVLESARGMSAGDMLDLAKSYRCLGDVFEAAAAVAEQWGGCSQGPGRDRLRGRFGSEQSRHRRKRR